MIENITTFLGRGGMTKIILQNGGMLDLCCKPPTKPKKKCGHNAEVLPAFTDQFSIGVG